MRPLTIARRAAGSVGRLASRFRRDVRGVYAVEFGLLAVPFFGILFATLEVGWVSYNAERLQAVVDRAARQLMTGQAQNANYANSSAFVSNLLCPTDGSLSVPGSWDCSRLLVDIRTAKDFSSADMTGSFYNKPTQFCLGTPSTIVVMRVAYPLESYLPLSIYNDYIGLANDYPNSAGWVHVLMGSAVFKTEPYTIGNGAAPSC